jgi:UDP-N-acetylmuramyl pentapeptide phosphotransferase/UDP-N-acetylglucosamine-1-phosphate transferase
VLFVAIGCGLIGFSTTSSKLRTAARSGSSGRWKMLLLLLITSASGSRTRSDELDTSIYIPVVDIDLALAGPFYPFLFLVIAGAANGVNLTGRARRLAPAPRSSRCSPSCRWS